MSTGPAANSPASPGGSSAGGPSGGNPSVPAAARPPVLVGRRVAVMLAGADGQDPHRLLSFHARNEHHLGRWLPPRPADFLTLDFWRRWCAQSLAAYKAESEVRLVLRPLEKPEAAILGQINFSTIVRGAAQSCTVGYHLGEAEQGRGLMTEALELAVGYMFDQRRLHRITACYQPDNERSARMLERLGFEKEGYSRSALFIDGSWRDHVMTARINASSPDPMPGAPL